MFGKEQPDVITDKQVGDYVKQLKKDGIKEIITEVDIDGLAFTRTKPTRRKKGKTRL